MSKKQLTPEEHLDKLIKSIGKRCEYNARKHTGKGKIAQVYQGGRGAWVEVATADKPVTVRPSQVRLF